MRTLGTRINLFDNNLTTDVESFNMLFPECPIVGFEKYLNVEIGEIVTANTRLLNIEGTIITHNLTRLLRSEEIEDETNTDIINSIDNDLN